MTPEQFEHFMQQQQAEQNLQQSQPQEQYNPEMDHADLDARFEAFRLEQDIEKQLAASQKKEGYGEEYDSFLRQQVGLTLQSDEYNGDPSVIVREVHERIQQAVSGSLKDTVDNSSRSAVGGSSNTPAGTPTPQNMKELLKLSADRMGIENYPG